jgi:hypothetical protein
MALARSSVVHGAHAITRGGTVSGFRGGEFRGGRMRYRGDDSSRGFSGASYPADDNYARFAPPG